jgi:hyaluronan synthase
VRRHIRVAASVGAATAVTAWALLNGAGVALVLVVTFGLFLVRLVLGWAAAPSRGEVGDCDVAVVLTLYNEDPELLRRCLASLAAQTRPPSRVWIVDDGSKDRAAFAVAERFEAPFDVHPIRCEVNRGKREAQAEAFRRDARADFFVTSDSDTVFHPDAIAEGLRPFEADGVVAVAGMVRALNRGRNLLTRMQDAEYHASFLCGRSWQSKLGGSVLVTAGGLSLYRAGFIREVLDEYLEETFLGRTVLSGDDRMLTGLALQRGAVELQHTAVVDTAVPERLSHLVRQRVRWGRSFYVGTLWLFRNLEVASRGFWLTVYRTALISTTLTTTLLVSVVAPAVGLRLVGTLLASIAAFGYLSSARILAVRLPGRSVWSRLATFLWVGPACVFQFVVLNGVHLWALLKVREVGAWGTRQQVELTTEPSASPAPASTSAGTAASGTTRRLVAGAGATADGSPWCARQPRAVTGPAAEHTPEGPTWLQELLPAAPR